MIAITLNHEKLNKDEIKKTEEIIEHKFKIPAIDPIWDPKERFLQAVLAKIPSLKEKIRRKKAKGTGGI